MDPRTTTPDADRDGSPFDATTLSRALVRPDVAIDLVLASPSRFAATLGSPQRLGLAALTFGIATVFALPFGAYFGLAKTLHVALLFVGSVLVCYPSLHVFAAYVGIPLRVEQSAALAMLAAAVASTFSLGFAPIVFFLRATIAEGAEVESMTPIVNVLLGGAFLAGMVQVVRCLIAGTLEQARLSLAPVMTGWFVLLGFIALRMSRLLGLGA